MGTRSCILLQSITDESNYVGVYCHWDGYPEHHLPILQENYNTWANVNDLLSHGSMSSLEARCDGGMGHSFEYPLSGQTVYYGRDRGETGQEPHYTDNLIETLKKYDDMGCEYAYVFSNGKWKWTALDDNISELTIDSPRWEEELICQ